MNVNEKHGIRNLYFYRLKLPLLKDEGVIHYAKIAKILKCKFQNNNLLGLQDIQQDVLPHKTISSFRQNGRITQKASNAAADLIKLSREKPKCLKSSPIQTWAQLPYAASQKKLIYSQMNLCCSTALSGLKTTWVHAWKSFDDYKM